MKSLIFIILLSFSLSSFAQTQVRMTTSLGDMVIELNETESPVTTSNFLQYVNDKFYDGLIFHRVISNFVIQGGGHTPDMEEVITREPIINEANNGLSNIRGTIAMARETAPHTATAQFYFNVQNNIRLDYQSEAKWGYCVFGRLIKGLDVMDKIRHVKTSSRGEYNDVPVEAVILFSVAVL